MDLELTPDQRELRDVAHQALDARSPLSLARSFLEGQPAEPLHALMVELGWYAVGLEEDDGFGLPGLTLLAEQVGSHAAPTALVDTAVAGRIGASLAGPQAAAVRSGERSVALAVLESNCDWELAAVMTSLTTGADGSGRLNGRKLGVQHAATVDDLLVVATADGAPAVALVPADARGRSDAGVRRRSGRRGGECDAGRRGRTGRCVPQRRAHGARPRVGVRRRSGRHRGRGDWSCLRGPRSGCRVLAGAPSVRTADRQLPGSQAPDGRRPRRSRVGMVLSPVRRRGARRAGGRGLEAASIAAAHGARASRSVIEAALQVLGGIAFTWGARRPPPAAPGPLVERRFGDALTHERRLGAGLAPGARW